MTQLTQRKWSLAACLGVGLLIVAMAPNAFGQATATLTGLVTDQTTAVIPGADVILIDEASGDTRRSISNEEGYFTFTALMAKTYKVRVEMAGFQTWERPGVVVHVADKIHIGDIVMVPGAPSEVVTVSGGANQMIPVDSGEKSNTITAAQIQNIPVVGRDATELLRILPGMVQIAPNVANRAGYTGENIGINGNGAGGKQSAIGNYSGNGGRADAIDITSDGTHVSDPGCNCASPVNPNVDMIQEFKVQGAAFSAENSKGPVVVSSVSKSGGAEFHGEGYFYTRQSSGNSADWFANYNSLTKPNNDYYYPGFNIGGPLLIPGLNKDRNKLFFFTALEYIDQNIDTGVRRTIVPTEAMRKGDFSDQAYLDKLNGGWWPSKSRPNGNGFVDGKLTGQPDPGGLALMSMLPLPNMDPGAANADGYNWKLLSTVNQPMVQFLTRVDYSISENTKLYTRYNMQREDQPQQFGMWWDHAEVPVPSLIVARNASDSISTNLSHVFNPTLTNEFTFGYTYIDFPNKFQDPSKVSRTALNYPYKGVFKNNSDTLPGFTDWGSGGVADMELDGGFNPVLFATKHLASVGDNVTKVMSTHTFKAGFYYEYVVNKQPNHAHDNGLLIPFLWGGDLNTGNQYANLLIGVGDQFQQTNQSIVLDEAYKVMEGFVQDSWKVRPDLTLEYGVRLSHLGPWYGRGDAAMGVWDPQRYSNNPADLTKYTGIVTNLTDPSVPRSGTDSRAMVWGPRFGMAYSIRKDTVLRGGFGAYNFHDPQQQDPLKNPPQTLSTTISGGIRLRDMDNVPANLAKTSANVVSRNDDKLPVTYNWNFTISQRMPRQMLLEASYVGNTSRNLLTGGINLNAVPEGTVFRAPGETVNWDDFRPFGNYGAINENIHDDYSNYHSLQMLLAKQTGRLTYSAAYTFSKALGIRNGGGGTGNGLGNTFLREQRQYGVLAFDRTHAFNISWSYLVPDVFRGNAIGSAIVNGWQFTGITSVQSGINLGSQIGRFNMDVSITDPANPGATLGIGDAQVTGTDSVPVMPILICDPRKGLQDGQYINGACFAAPTLGANGRYTNGNFQFPYLRGPGYMNHDLSIFKNFQMGKNEDRKLQLRFAAYNFLNHPLDSFEKDDESNLQLDFLDGKLRNDRFGYTQMKYGRRILQAAIKFMF